MLGIILSYHSFFEFLPYQIRNIRKYVSVPHRIYIVDNSDVCDVRRLQTILNLCPYPYGYIRNPDVNNSPSGRHMTSVNLGLDVAWKDCDSFLIFDNDMIFLSEWHEPQEDLYYEHCQRGNWEYCWQNLLYMKKKSETPFVFTYYRCPETGEGTDSGGNTGLLLRNPTITKQRLRYISEGKEREQYLSEYQIPFHMLCKEYGHHWWFDVYDFNKTLIFHFRAMSNYPQFEESFMEKKKKLILSTMESREKNLMV